MRKKVTKRIGMDNIAMAKWFLKEYTKSSKSSASYVTTTNEQVTLVLFTNNVHDLCQFQVSGKSTGAQVGEQNITR